MMIGSANNIPVVIPNFRYAMIPSKGPTFISIASTLEVPDRKASAKNPSIDPSEPPMVSIAFAISEFIEVPNGNLITFSMGLLKDKLKTVKTAIAIAEIIIRRRSSSRCSQKVIATSLDSIVRAAHGMCDQEGFGGLMFGSGSFSISFAVFVNSS